MAKVRISIGGRDYDIACRNGDEERFRALGGIVDVKAGEAARAAGGLTEVRQLLFAALLLADEVESARTAPPPAAPEPAAEPDPAAAIAIERLAARAEALADRLEQGVAAS